MSFKRRVNMERVNLEILFKALNSIKDTNVELFEIALITPPKKLRTPLKNEISLLQKKIETDEEVEALKRIQSDIIENVILDILTMIDGYGNLEFEVDLVDRKTKQPIRSGTELHDGFATYLSGLESGSSN
jgi:hypothetical protein